MFENKAIMWALIFVAFYLVWMIVVLWVVARNTPKKDKPRKYDERQIAAQGTAYKAAFWSMIAYVLLYTIVFGSAEIVWCDQYLAMFLTVILGVTMFAVVCIFKDAYFRPDQSSAAAMASINVICFSQGCIGLMHLSDGTVIENGVLTADSLQLFVLLMGIIIDVAFLIKRRMDKRQEQEGIDEKS